MMRQFLETDEGKALAQELGLSEKTFGVEDFKKFAAENEEARRLIQSEADRAVSKGIETWKQNNLELEARKLVEKAKPKEEPNELTSIKQKLEELETNLRAERLNSAKLKYFTDNKIPLEFEPYVKVSSEEDLTKIKDFSELINRRVQDEVKKQLGKYSRTDVRSEKNDVPNPYGSNPWDVGSMNLDLQMKIYKEDRSLAEYLKKIAKK